MAALHLDNLLFLLFVALAIFFQILTKVATKGRRRPGDTTGRSISPSQRARPVESESEETDADRIRKFLEALGQPTTSKPPAPVAPRPTYQRPTVLPHVPPFGSPLPPLKTRPPDLPRETVREVPRPDPVPVMKTAADETYEPATQVASKSAEAKIDLTTMLKSSSGLRDAIILREIFGPPRSLQPLDLVGSV
jgi:type IV secretory pathway VirB10-like protein